MERFSIFDMEGDSLNPTKIHCVSVYTYDRGKVHSYTLTDYEKMRHFFKSEEILIGHNIIRWDKPHIERLLDIKIKGFLIDTLILSWYLFPMRNSHGLDGWGQDLGIAKPKVEDWSEQPLEVYINRCEEDVKINTKLFENCLTYLKLIYDNYKETGVNYMQLIRYLMFKMDCALEQEQVKWRLDKDTCNKNLQMFKEGLKEKTLALVEHMPDNISIKEVSPPKKMYKKDGTVSSLGKKWFNLLEELCLPEDFTGTLKVEKDREKGNPGSHQQIKDWLYSLGWKPQTFKYEKDKETGKVSRIEQINLPHGGGVCPSIKKLYNTNPELKNLEDFYVLRHRISILKGFLRDVDEQGYLQAKVAGLTNTLRFKHAVLVNLPGVTGKNDWKDGIYIRECLIAPDGYVLCGSDMSSLEDRTKQHFMYYFDPEYVNSMIKPGFDPHLDLAEFAYKMTNGEIGISPEDAEWYKNGDHKSDPERYQRIKNERHAFKTVNYAAVYGSGAPTLSRTSGMSLDRCKVLLRAYWEKNWSVKKVSKSCKIKTLQHPDIEYEREPVYDEQRKLLGYKTVRKEVIREQMWLFNPVSKFWYSLRYLKDKFSTLNQGTGVYCFDNWVLESRQRGLKMCGQFHDEIAAPVKEEKKQYVKNILEQAINSVNQKLNLNRELAIDVQFGESYAEIH